MRPFTPATTIATFLSLALLPLQGSGQEPIDTQSLFEKKCSACHSANRPKSLNKTKEEWIKTVTRMQEKRNSNVTTDEVNLIITYLTKAYGK